VEWNNGNYEESLRVAGDTLHANPNLFPAQLIRAKVLLAKGNAKEGQELLQALLDRDPTSLPALTTLVDLRIRGGRSREVLSRMEKLAEQYPQNAGVHFLLAAVYFDLKDLRRAEASARQAVTHDLSGSDAYTLLAQVHIAQASPGKAMGDLRAAIDRNPHNVANYMALRSLYEKQGNWKEATRLCEKAREVDPTNPLVANDLAYLYLEHSGDVNTALSLAQAAKQELPASNRVADTLGWAYYKLGSPELAITQLRQAMQKAPHDSVYEYHLGVAYMAAGQFDSAERLLQQALRDNPNFADAASARATLYKTSKLQH
jgi:Flp pilus assembly protein TadD